MDDAMDIYDDLEQYLRQNEPDKYNRGVAWTTAIGLQQVDGLKTSEYLHATARRNIEGEISIDEAQNLIKSYYLSKENRDSSDDDYEQADKVSANIARLLGEKAFVFSPIGLISVHRRIFNGVFSHAGTIRNYNITKKEWILNGDTVHYAPASEIMPTLEYDFSEEKKFSYRGLDIDGVISHLAQFVSGIWQIHPFQEGNTRTTAVFLIKYLRTLGYKVDNKPFAENSWYFRNALVRANVKNAPKGIDETMRFLIRFFENLLKGENHDLKNRHMHVGYKPTLDQSTYQITDQPTNRSTDRPTKQISRLLAVMTDEPVSREELMRRLSLRHIPSFRKSYLHPALDGGFIERTLPDNPTAQNQQYVLTKKGIAAKGKR